MKLDSTSKAKLALGVVLTLALASATAEAMRSYRIYRATRAADSDVATADRPSHHEARLQPLKELLPPRGVLGYVSDGVEGGAFANLEAMQDYLLTQYALAPVIVVLDTGRPQLVGVFSDSLADTLRDRALAERGFAVLRDLGGGVLLLGRER